MTVQDKDGWFDNTPRTHWICPECGVSSPVEDWEECEVYCEDCGSHEARSCPNCDERFDAVWGGAKLADVN